MNHLNCQKKLKVMSFEERGKMMYACMCSCRHACVVSRKKDRKRGHAHAKGVDPYEAASGRDTSYAHNRLDKALFGLGCPAVHALTKLFY